MKSFVKLAKGIPPNWPENCPLIFDQENSEVILTYSWDISYKGAPTIKDWRELIHFKQKYDEAIGLIKKLNGFTHKHGREYRAECGKFLTNLKNHETTEPS